MGILAVFVRARKDVRRKAGKSTTAVRRSYPWCRRIDCMGCAILLAGHSLSNNVTLTSGIINENIPLLFVALY
jgi:hypothetical protein